MGDAQSTLANANDTDDADDVSTDADSGSESYGIGSLFNVAEEIQESQETGVENSSLPESPDDHNVSGTTLLQTDSESDTGDADTLLMVDSLPDLHRAASAILDLFAANSSTPSGISSLARALQDPKSSQSRRLQRMRDNFATQKNCFGNDTYLIVEQVAAKLPVLTLPSDSPTKSWRADGILYKSNCAQLALEILTKATRTGEVEDSMYDLEGKYPLPFLNVLVRNSRLDLAGQSSLRRPTFDLALEMRTQFLMTSLVSQQDRDNYDPRGLLQHVFFNEILETQTSQDETMLRGFNLPSLQDRDGNLPEQYEDDVQDRVRDIQEYFNDGGAVDYEGLEARFPWEGFVYSVAKWLRSRNEELDRFLKQQPAVDEIHNQLEEAVNNRVSQAVATPEQTKAAATSSEITSSQQRRRELLPAAEITEKRADATPGQAKERRKSNSRIFSDQRSIQSLVRIAKALEQTNESTLESAKDFAPRLSQLAAKPAEKTKRPITSTTQRAEETVPVASFSTDPDQTLIGDFQEDLIIPSPQRSPQRSLPVNRPRQQPPTSTQAAATSSQSIPSSRSILEEIKRHKQGRAFIDRQSNASRVSPIDSQRLGQGSSSQPRKRTRVETNESDDEYEQDNRNVDLQNKRAQKPAQPAKRQRQDPEVEPTQMTPQRPRQIPWQAAEKHHEPPSARPPPATTYTAAVAAAVASPPAYSTQPSASQQSASQTSPTRLPNGARIPQVRRRWSTAEDKRLVELVGKYGTSWAAVKHQDEASTLPQLGDRNQVQIKDRARNLVMMWLKGGRQDLPLNFDLVALKQKDVEELESRGISVPNRPLPRTRY
ncbi:Eukaryotic translation initiation factor 3 subunit A [Talaromyces islandicus]|uniref:Eukaryotic translation initiation factor 3 subunit A n=1 Tax=Talaromyces islandicus TaxID=28573 RepID=A0A0U1LIJ3_TALIS|nr:Eukaryotic translation initiation factor 3 subunit A [Talaromyces islandicus]